MPPGGRSMPPGAALQQHVARAYSSTLRDCRCAPTLRFTLWSALSTVFVSHASRSAIASYEWPSRYSDSTELSSSDSTLDRHATRLCSSSLEITWFTGSCATGPGRTSSSVGSESPAAAGVAENDTYWLSGVCLLRVEVLTAVMIWWVMHSSAKLRKLDSRSDR